MLTTLRNRIPLLAKLGERVIGLCAKRRLPVPAQESFVKRRGEQQDRAYNPVTGEVALLVDTFTNSFNPENAEAAIRVLNRAGYIVHPVSPASQRNRPLCCGRTQLAQGMVDDARNNARCMIAALLPHVLAGHQVIGLEPSCLLAIRDDYSTLGLGEDAAKVASQAMLFEEFIAREVQAKRFTLQFDAIRMNEPLLLHGHCHQKAVGAMKSMRKVLKLIPELKFEFIEASCCGMAGSFGLEKEHADIAMQMAWDALIPAINAQPKARVLANGFSCRKQINEGANRESTHLAVLLDEALPK